MRITCPLSWGESLQTEPVHLRPIRAFRVSVFVRVVP